MWLHWSKPTSPFVATISLAVMIISGFFNFLGGVSGIPKIILMCVFFGSLSIWLGMLIFWAPYKVWKRDTEKLKEEKEQECHWWENLRDEERERADNLEKELAKYRRKSGDIE